MPKKTQTITVEIPTRPVRRSMWYNNREIEIDFRGIRSPVKSLIMGRVNPTLGQKRNFETPDSLKLKCDEYFATCLGPMLDKNGEIIKGDNGKPILFQKKPFTLSGLALYLGISTEALKRYSKGKFDEIPFDTDDRATFAEVLYQARQRIEEYAESRLYDKDGSFGAKFVLDNAFKWTTTKEQAEIKKIKSETKLKREEFEFKKKQAEQGFDDDSGFTINIKRASQSLSEGDEDDDN